MKSVRSLLLAPALVMGLSACGDSGVAPGRVLHIDVVSGADQEGLEGRALPRSVFLRVEDDGGRPIAGATVFLDAEGGGRVEPSQAPTGQTGLVEVDWTLGPSAATEQVLTARVDGAVEVLTVKAQSLPMELADVVILRGAAGPMRGLLLVRQSLVAMDVLDEALTEDTVIRLQPRSDGTGLVVFPAANALEWRDVDWTDAPDTVVIDLRPPVEIDVVVRVFVAPFEETKAAAMLDLQRTEEIWIARSVGLRLGAVTYLDRADPDQVAAVSAATECSTPAPAVLEVNYVHTVRGSTRAGQACAPGWVFQASESHKTYPYLLAHEIGHTFMLGHRSPGMMNPTNPTTWMTDGEVFQVNFHRDSGVNVQFNGHPEEHRRLCQPTLCLGANYVLGQR